MSIVTVKWFFDQLYGLADAIKHVHHLKKPSTPMHPEREDDYWGCHHDIKPENILIFEKVDNSHPVCQIADFGAGFLYNADANGVSRAVKKVPGTKTYFAPEDRGAALRPFDLWSLGCCFLELTLWLFRVSYVDGIEKDKFTQKRKFFSGHNPMDLNDSYWIKDDDGSFHLRKPVQDTIHLLRSTRCKDMTVFETLIDAIWSSKESLLTIDETKRMDANKLVDCLDGIRKHLEREEREMRIRSLDPFADDNDPYARMLERNTEGIDESVSGLLTNEMYTLPNPEPPSPVRGSIEEDRATRSVETISERGQRRRSTSDMVLLSGEVTQDHSHVNDNAFAVIMSTA